jgi:hypothetical protein
VRIACVAIVALSCAGSQTVVPDAGGDAGLPMCFGGGAIQAAYCVTLAQPWATETFSGTAMPVTADGGCLSAPGAMNFLVTEDDGGVRQLGFSFTPDASVDIRAGERLTIKRSELFCGAGGCHQLHVQAEDGGTKVMISVYAGTLGPADAPFTTRLTPPVCIMSAASCTSKPASYKHHDLIVEFDGGSVRLARGEAVEIGDWLFTFGGFTSDLQSESMCWDARSPELPLGFLKLR